MIGAHGMFHGMFAGAAADGHHLPGQIVCKGDTLTGFQICSILYRPDKVFPDIFDRSQRQHIPHPVMGFGNIAFRAVEQCVKSLVSRVPGWNGYHQFRIDHGQYGKQAVIPAKTNLFIGFIIRNHTPLICFRASACRCRNADHRKGFFFDRFSAAGTAVHIVPDIPFIRCHCSHCF